MFVLGLISNILLFAARIFELYESVSFLRISKKFDQTQALKTDELPKISVLISARDEAARLENSLQSLSDQECENLEFIVVNDRSSDSTGEIIDGFANKDKRFKAIHINDLPEGWLGKNHGLQKAYEASSGEYLLFTDADIVHKKGVFEKTIAYMNEQNLDSLVMAPEFKAGGPLHASILLYFSVLFLIAMRPSRSTKSKNFYIGAGVFNLMKRSFYQKMGEHKKIKLEVVDDLMLGKLLAVEGARAGVVKGTEWLSIHWYHSAREMMLGFEKNGFAALEYSYLRLILLFVVTAFFNVLPYIGIFIFEGIIPGLFIINLSIMYVFFVLAARRVGYNPLVCLLIPAAAWVMCFAHLRSAIITVKNQGIRWRETFYPLKDLVSEHKKINSEISARLR